jgi:hypothetical protein
MVFRKAHSGRDCARPDLGREDLNDGQDFGGVVVRNPFRGVS